MTTETLSPIDRQIAANNLARRNPSPDPRLRQEQERRKVDDPPLDLRSLSARSEEEHTVASKRAAFALETAHDSWTKIKAAAADPAVPLDKLATAASDAVARADTAIRNGIKDVDAQIAHFEKAVMDKAAPQISDVRAQEIRTMLRGMKPNDVARLARDHVEVSAALIRAPAFLSGLDAQAYETTVKDAKLAHAPDEVAKVADGEKVRSQLNRAETLLSTKLSGKVIGWMGEAEKRANALKKLEGMRE